VLGTIVVAPAQIYVFSVFFAAAVLMNFYESEGKTKTYHRARGAHGEIRNNCISAEPLESNDKPLRIGDASLLFG